MTAAFSGLGLSLGNLSRLSDAKTRSISPGELHRREGQGRHGDRGHRRRPCAAADLGPGLEDLALDPRSRPARPASSPTSTGRARSSRSGCTVAEPALARPDPAHLLGRPGAAVGRMPARRLLRHAAGTSFAQVTSLAVCVNPGRAFNCYWEMPFRKRARITLENRDPDEHGDPLLPDQLHADRGARGRGLLPRPVPPHQSAALQGGLHHPRRRHGAAATTSAPTWPGASTTPAGGARARSSSSWTATASSRPSAAPAPRTISAAPTTSTAASIDRDHGQPPTASSPRPMPACRR